ncbi:MAG TPA: PQQ-dependent sugar dehydrogenase [Ignavibacteriaceae bacterium]|nr:PQQ-dependent sugar dehydrogenase [Ignavibacteriaceae bacterium]
MTRKIALLFMAILIITGKNTKAQFNLQQAFPNLTFSSPVDMQYAPDGTDRLFVLEQSGIIKVFENNGNTTTVKTFLDITDRVTSGGETGLLGLAFHPDYANNGYFYVDYTTPSPLRTHVSRFQVTSNPDSADKSSELVLLEVNQPFSNHNGGRVSFGPDGYLYIGLGDGGSGGDPNDNAQNKTVLLGKILRIDVDNPAPPLNYGIPPDNPFAGNTQGWREEIYSFGLRNPWRFSFDPVTNWLWCGDVGQNAWEEIDTITSGGNYGWRCYEGNHEYNMTGCTGTDYLFPIWEYSHSGGNCSITGGFIYRGMRRPELTGNYIYADYCSAKVWDLDYSGVNLTNNLVNTASASVLSIGVDMNNELYILCSNGKIYEFQPAVGAPTDLIAGSGGSGTVDLSWIDNSDNETGFRIQRKDSTNIFSDVGTVGAGITTFTDNVGSIATYTYRVIAYNDTAVSNYSNETEIMVTQIPVEMISFSVNVSGNKILINWVTATEQNNKGYDIERNFGDNWASIGFVKGHGTTTEKNTYSFTDDFTNDNYRGTIQYRLKQIDYDGTFHYSGTVMVNLDIKTRGYYLDQNFPNPFNPTTKIRFNVPEQSRVKVEIINVLGKVVEELYGGEMPQGTYEKVWDASRFASGVYYVRMKAESEVSGNTYFRVLKMLYLK